ncbi:MAG: polyhydroxyalkanoate synthesis repressor PhaR [Alphaproteobacteria bacterium]|nr:polyhydroxyalkanoate synthesis repressor PhaR [Alphaproteobacteria bacterium]
MTDPARTASDTPAGHAEGEGQRPVVVKKYANRRLYNTEASSYVTLDHLAQMVKEGREFVVYDAKTGEDITRSVLTQIIVEEEGKGQNLLPISFLRQLITFYGDSLQSLVPRYLEASMGAFARNQEQMRRTMQQALGMFPFAQSLEEMGKQNMAMMERAFSMFAPFYGTRPGGPSASEPPPPAAPAPAPAAPSGAEAAQALEALKEQVEALQRQLEGLARQGAARGGGNERERG